MTGPPAPRFSLLSCEALPEAVEDRGFLFLVTRYKHHPGDRFQHISKLVRLKLCYFYFFFRKYGKIHNDVLKCYNKHLPFAIPTESPDVHQ